MDDFLPLLWNGKCGIFERESSRMAESIGAIGMEMPSKSSFGSVPEHVVSFCEGEILTTIDDSRFSACQNLLEISRRAERVRASLMPLV